MFSRQFCKSSIALGASGMLLGSHIQGALGASGMLLGLHIQGALGASGMLLGPHIQGALGASGMLLGPHIQGYVFFGKLHSKQFSGELALGTLSEVTSGKVGEPSPGKAASWQVSLVPRQSWRRSWLGWRHPEGFGFPVFHTHRMVCV